MHLRLQVKVLVVDQAFLVLLCCALHLQEDLREQIAGLIIVVLSHLIFEVSFDVVEPRHVREEELRDEGELDALLALLAQVERGERRLELLEDVTYDFLEELVAKKCRHELRVPPLVHVEVHPYIILDLPRLEPSHVHKAIEL